MTNRRNILLHCTGCGETWLGPERLMGNLCSDAPGRVRPATKDEGDLYRQEAER